MKAILETQDSSMPKENEIVRLGDWLHIKQNGKSVICMVMLSSMGYNLVSLDGNLLLAASLSGIENINRSLNQDNTEWSFIELRYKFKEL